MTEIEITEKPAEDNFKYKCACSGKIIKNCRGAKKCNDGINRMKKEEQRDNFRSL